MMRGGSTRAGRAASVLVGLVVATTVGVAGAGAQDPLEEAEREADAASARLEALVERRAELQVRLDRAVQNFEGRRAQFGRLDRRETLLVDELGRLRAEAAAAVAARDDFLRQLYKHPPEVLVEWVARQESIEDAIHRALTIPRVVRAGRARLEAAEEQEEDLLVGIDALDGVREDAAVALGDLVEAQDELDALLREVAVLEARAREVAAATAGRVEELAAAVDRRGADGQVCPVAPPNSFVDTWGAPRSGGRRHQGVDIFAPEGTPLYATADGVVDRTDTLGLGGITVHLRSDTGDVFYYAHLSGYGPGIEPGRRVAAGEVVGYVGRTGNARSTPPHLHWEHRPGGGSPVNPTQLARQLCR